EPAPKNNPANSPPNHDGRRAGEIDGQRTVVPTNQVLAPAGRQVAFSGRPTDIALSPNGGWLAVLERSHVVIIDPKSGEMVSQVSHASGSYAGILFTADGKRLLASNIRGTVGVFDGAAD